MAQTKTLADLPEEIRARVADATLAHVGTDEPSRLVAARVDQLRVGDVAYVLAFGAWRSGVVVKLTRTRATIAYRTPSNRDLVRLATTSTARVGAYFFTSLHPERA